MKTATNAPKSIQKNGKSGERTLELKSIIIACLAISLLGWLRLEQAVYNREWLSGLVSSIFPVYLSISGFIWGTAGLAEAVALWFNLKVAHQYARAMIIIMASWFWVERIYLTRSQTGWSNLPFSIIFTSVCLVYAFVVLEHPHQKHYFEKNLNQDEHKIV